MRLKELRVAKGFRQKDVAEMLGVDRTTYVKYESGTSEPNKDTFVRLAEIFDVSTDYLLERTDKKEPSLTDTDERRLNESLIERLSSLTPEEQSKVEAFVQGMIASRPAEASPPA